MVVKAATLEVAHSRGASAWPDIDVPLELFRAHAERLALDDRALLAHAPDLFLVAGALRGQKAALRHFDRQLTAVSAVVTRIDRSEPFLEDVRQELRVKLLSGPAPRLEKYAATGALKDWLRVAALRVGLNLKRSDRLQPAPDLELESLLGAGKAYGVERAYIASLKEAIEGSLASLTARERTLLRLHFVDGQSLDRIGVMYSVHRATVARWLVGVRAKVFEKAKLELAERHGLATADVKSLYRILESDVNASVSRILRS